VLPAVLHTVRAFDLDPSDFERFLDSMAADLHTDGYATYQDLRLHGGSAAAGQDLRDRAIAPLKQKRDFGVHLFVYQW
jgi:hypothetical protein